MPESSCCQEDDDACGPFIDQEREIERLGAELRETITRATNEHNETIRLQGKIERLLAALQKIVDRAWSPDADVACIAKRALEQRAPIAELEPHAYVPSAMHMGDCAVCGHLQGSAIHSPFRRAAEQSAGPDPESQEVASAGWTLRGSQRLPPRG